MKRLKLVQKPIIDARDQLIRVARMREVIEYQQHSDAAALNFNMSLRPERNKHAHMLYLIAKFEAKCDRPCLCALVVRAKGSMGGGKPGGGFWKMVEALSLMEYEGESPTEAEKNKWLDEEQRRVWQYWCAH